MKIFYKTSGNTYYIRFINRITGYVWDDVAEAMGVASSVTWANSVVEVSEVGESGQYPIVLPTDLPKGATYDAVLYHQDGDSPANTDQVDEVYQLKYGSTFGF